MGFQIPVLLIIGFALLSNWGSKAFVAVKTTYEVVKERLAEADETTRAIAPEAPRILELH